MDIVKIVILVILFAFASASHAVNKIPKLYYSQSVVGSTLVTKISTVSGTRPLPVVINTVDTYLINNYVGLYYNPVTAAYYYSYLVNIDVGSNTKIPVTYRTRVSYNAIADMSLDVLLNKNSFTSTSYLQDVIDFFITPSYAIPLPVIQIIISSIEAIAVVYGIVVNANNQVSDSKGSTNDYCYNAVIPRGVAKYCYYAPYGGPSCCVNGSPSVGFPKGFDFSPRVVTKGAGSDSLSNGLKTAGSSPIAKATAVVDLIKHLYDLYQSYNSSPSSSDPGGDSLAPSDKDNYSPPSGTDAPSNIEAKAKDDHGMQGETSKDKGTTTSTNPDGTQTRDQKKLDIQYDGDTIITKVSDLITKLDALGNVISAITSLSAPEAAIPQSDLCQDHPTIIACSEWGIAPKPDVIPSKEIPVTLDIVPSSAGSCPAGIALDLSFGQKTFSYAPICQAAMLINPFMIVLGYIAAGFILYGSVRD